MDLHFTTAAPSPEESALIDEHLRDVLSATDEGGREARSRRHLLLPVLHVISDRFGWISEGALNHICRRLDVPPADAYGVATFYGLFSMTPQPERVAFVCDDIACMAAGAGKLCAELEGALDKTQWKRSPCLGLCDRAPATLIRAFGRDPVAYPVGPATTADVAHHVNPAGGKDFVSRHRLREPNPNERLLRRVDRVDPFSLKAYRASGGYQALARALDLGPAGVIREISESKLSGRGGAAFPTGRKWEAVASQSERPHYLVCNADESEPGAFKDRILMEGDPFAIVEAMTIAAFAGGCEHGYIYVRGEYVQAAERMAHAIGAAKAQGLLGPDIMGRGLAFDVEMRRGAGAYVCGEETALFNSIEGHRGEPRNKPPFPVEHGLFGKPTIVNNVETLANVPDIVLEGGKAFASIGTQASSGTKLFCVTGHVTRPGLYEVPFGVALRALIDMAGGTRGGKRIQAVLLGGAAGTFLKPDELDVPLSLEGTREIGASVGSGVVLVLDEDADLRTYLLRIAAFFREESCGQCVPCRVGTVRQEELLTRLTAGMPLGSRDQERALLAQLGQVMRDASICGLGQTASSAIESAFAKFAL